MTALVTGASRGIGAEIARTLDQAGMRVALAARDEHKLHDVAADLEHNPVVLRTDLRNPEEPASLAQNARDALGHIDVLVNNAGVSWRGNTEDMGLDVIRRILDVNLRSPLLLISALIPHMAERGAGRIINITSVSGVVGTPNRAAYAASKGGLDAATRSLAVELGPLAPILHESR